MFDCTISVLLTLVISSSISGNKLEDELSLEVKALIQTHRKQMAIINTFDAYYNAVLTNENLIKLIEPLCAELKIIDKWAQMEDIRNHYRFFISTDFQLPTKEQAFAIGYMTYLSYWATIKLRICAMLFTTNKQKPENQVLYSRKLQKEINYRRQLYRYMQRFTVIEMKKKITHFTENLKLSQLPSTSERSSRVSDANKIGKKLLKLDLDFIMDADYFETSFSQLKFGSVSVDSDDEQTKTKCEDNNSSIRLKEINEKMLEETKSRDDEMNENTEDLEDQSLNQKTEVLFRTALPYDNASYLIKKKDSEKILYKRILDVISNGLASDILEIEDYFSMVIEGIIRTKNERQIKDLFPDYESMSSYCDGFSDYIKKNLDVFEEKPKYAESFQSIAAEILREITERTTLRKLALLSENNQEEVTSTEKLEQKKKEMLPSVDILQYRGEFTFELVPGEYTDYILQLKKP